MAGIIFILASITDVFDGIIARKCQAVSDFGKLLDPLADKILVMAALIMLSSLRDDVLGHNIVPPWLVILILGREIWVTGLRSLAATNGMILAANESGKIKSFFQMLGIIFILFKTVQFHVLGYILPAHFIGLNFLLISIIFSYWAAIEYTSSVFTNISTKPN